MEFIIPLAALMFIGWYYTGKVLDLQAEEIKKLQKATEFNNTLAREAYKSLGEEIDQVLEKLKLSNSVLADAYNSMRQGIVQGFNIVDANHIDTVNKLNEHAFYIERYHCSFLEYYFNNLHLKKTITAPGYEVYTEVASPEQEMALRSKIMKLDAEGLANGWIVSLPDNGGSNSDNSQSVS